MRVLIACETSGVVRKAMRARGHDAYSCDLRPADDGSPYHYQRDVRAVLGPAGYWDLLIVHLPCTYMTNAGVWAFTRTPPHPGTGVLYGEARRAALREAAALWNDVAAAPIARIAMENPVPHHYATDLIGTYTQTIQPYQFGDDASKRTCLWLKGLPPLIIPPRDRWIAPRMVNGRPRWANQTDSGQNKLTPGPDRWKARSRTYAGIAEAMADQWGKEATD